MKYFDELKEALDGDDDELAEMAELEMESAEKRYLETKEDLEIVLDNITGAMGASSYSAVVDTVKKICSHFLPLDISAKETIMGCCIHIVRADQAVTEKEKININLIKDELGL